MRYELDIRDINNVYGIGAVMECSPTFRIFLDKPVGLLRLRLALYTALEALPYFRTRLVRDGRFWLESNYAEPPIHHCRFEDRPLRFGKDGEGFPFQISYFENELTFDMCHFPCDALGFLYFVKAVLAAYYGAKPEFEPDIYLKLPCRESYNCDAVKPLIGVQAQGFRAGRMESIPRFGTSHCTLLSTSLKHILIYRDRVDSSPAAIISALLAKTFRNHLSRTETPLGESNNVCGKIVVSTRKALDVTTVHNCYLQAFITYTDAFDKFDFSTVCSIYRAILDLESQKKCAQYDVKLMTEAVLAMEENPNQALAWETVRRDTLEARKSLCNFNFSYLGAVSFNDAAAEHIVDFQAICLNENCDFGILAYSCGERLYLMISENYVDKGFIKEFIEEGNKQDIIFDTVSDFDYRQAYFEFSDNYEQN